MVSLREAGLFPGRLVEMVGFAFHGLTPHGNRYCRAFGAFRLDGLGRWDRDVRQTGECEAG